MINKVRYWYYSRNYKRFYSKEFLNRLKEANMIYLGRQNGKRIAFTRVNYIKAVENYNFKLAKAILKGYKAAFNKELFWPYKIF